MGRKPTGRKPGRPTKPINEALLQELGEIYHQPEEWHALFDLYNELEEKGASSELLRSVENQIQSTYGSRYRLQRNAFKLQKLFECLSTAITWKRQHQELRKVTHSLIPKDEQFDDHVLTPLRRIRDSIRTQKRIISDPELNWIKKSINDGKKITTESEFVFEASYNMALKLVRSRTLPGKKGKPFSTYSILDSDSDGAMIALKAVEKILKGSAYDPTRPDKDKLVYIKRAVTQEALDLYKHRKRFGVPDEHENQDSQDEAA